MTIKNDYLVEKSNVLNEMRSNNMTLQELRFFSIYLAKINARQVDSRLVKFPMEDFKNIMEYGRINIQQLENTANSLLSKVVKIRLDSGGFIAFQIFKKCRVDTDINGDWYVEIDAHDEALPLMFELKSKYFTYQLWNALRLKSTNQLRMYEILKQCEKIGERILSVIELKALLGLNVKEHKRFGDFKDKVLGVCQKALRANTDIQFDYEPHGKKGPGGKILALKFTINKNTNYIDRLSLSKFIDIQQNILEIQEQEDESELNTEMTLVDKTERSLKDMDLELFSDAFENEFSHDQVRELRLMAVPYVSYHKKSDKPFSLAMFEYLYSKFLYLNTRKNVENRYAYIKKIIDIDCKSVKM